MNLHINTIIVLLRIAINFWRWLRTFWKNVVYRKRNSISVCWLYYHHSSPTITIVFCIKCTSNRSSKNIRNGSLAGYLIFMVYVVFRRLSCPILRSNKSFSCKKRSIRFLDQTMKCCRSKIFMHSAWKPRSHRGCVISQRCKVAWSLKSSSLSLLGHGHCKWHHSQ